MSDGEFLDPAITEKHCYNPLTRTDLRVDITDAAHDSSPLLTSEFTFSADGTDYQLIVFIKKDPDRNVFRVGYQLTEIKGSDKKFLTLYELPTDADWFNSLRYTLCQDTRIPVEIVEKIFIAIRILIDTARQQRL